MSNKNSLANKKRKRIKFDATSGSISGFLLSSSESVEVSNSPPDKSGVVSETHNLSAVSKNKSRLSNDFDDSFDLFASKKVLQRIAKEVLPPRETSPRKKGMSNTIKSLDASPAKKCDDSPSKQPNSNSPQGRKAKGAPVRKCDYFDKPITFPCPFCFKFEEEIYTHISSNCIKPSCISDSSAAKLMEIHMKYWDQRRKLGIPDFTINEDEVFKPPLCQGQKISQVYEESVSDTKIPFLKWNSKSKKNKYLLLRQTQSEREIKITQRLALVLMDDKCEPTNVEGNDISAFDKSVISAKLIPLLNKELTFWKKSSLSLEEAHENLFYIEALAPFIAPLEKKISEAVVTASLEKVEENCEVEIFSGENLEVESFMPNVETTGTQTIDTCFAETKTPGKSTDDFNSKQLSCSDISRNWGKMFFTSDLSDMTVLFSNGYFLGHSLVFYAHSMKIFRSISSSSGEESGKLLDWKDITANVGKAFIKYIYCGTLDHLKDLSCSDLESVKNVCNKYDEFNLESFITDLIMSKKSLEKIANESYNACRNLTSPDIFGEENSIDEGINSACTLSVNLEYSSNSLNSSKRKLELPMDSIDKDNSIKRFKTEHNSIVDSDTNAGRNPVSEITDMDDIQNEVISVISEDRVSISSGATMSPRNYEKISHRPLSQCSTLPPLSESPKLNEDASRSSSPIFPNSPLNSTVIQPQEESKEPDCNKPDNKPQTNCDGDNLDDSFYFDNEIYDYNNYIDVPLREINSPDLANPDSNQSIQDAVNEVKNSFDKYFDDSLPVDLIESPMVCKTPQSRKSINGSPLYKSTPNQPILPPDETTPSPQIIVSDKATPLMNYSTIITPELKGELRKYGLKPDMDRKKAKTLLRYIYDLIHPIVPGMPGGDSNGANAELAGPCRAENGDQDAFDLDLSPESRPADNPNTSSESILAHDNPSSEGEEEFELDEDEVVLTQAPSSYLNRHDLLKAVSNFIKGDTVLFESILQYIPIWLSKFHQALKESNIKCTKVDLMDVLDELCITYRTERRVQENGKSKR